MHLTIQQNHTRWKLYHVQEKLIEQSFQLHNDYTLLKKNQDILLIQIIYIHSIPNNISQQESCSKNKPTCLHKNLLVCFPIMVIGKASALLSVTASQDR